MATTTAAFDPPPYGRLNLSLELWRRRHPVPDGFRIGNMPADESKFTAWVDTQVDLLSNVLWPRFKPDSAGRWKGSAAAHAEKLTRTDIQLMLDLRRFLPQAPEGRGDSVRTHKYQFVVEDVGDQWAAYADYDNEIPAELMATIKTTMAQASIKIRSTAVVFKQTLQRPRAYQMAPYLGIDEFTYEDAQSAATPSMLSGHCIQGLMAATTTFITHRQELEDTADSTRNLQQWGVDHGDRRVFAGVHYPSDNIASWYVLLAACDNFLFGPFGQDARDFLWAAISGKSAVFEAMAKAGGVYEAPLEMIKKIATTKVTN